VTTTSSSTRALVTGASSGIGAALARRLAARGVEVWLAARRRPMLEACRDEILAAGGAAHVLELDVSHTDETAERLAGIDAEVGGFDLVIANAGIGGKAAAQRPSRVGWSDVRDLLQINLLGAAATLVPFVGPMVARGRGHLVGISSLAGDLPVPRGAAYGASKAGLTYLLRAIDVELRPLGVVVTAVLPGFVRTDMTSDLREAQMPFLISLPRAAELIDRGIRRRARIVRFPWQTALLAKLGSALPYALSDALLRRATLGPKKS
jgi:short-subunit dehydrogenase